MIGFLLLMVMSSTVWANQIAISPLEFLQKRNDAHTSNSNQFSISVTADRTIRTLVVKGYSTYDITNSVCSGSLRNTATMTAASDQTMTSGNTYAATDASSWAMVNNNGGATSWKTTNTRCVYYEFQDSLGSNLHSKHCQVWYAASGTTNCSSGSCGQNTSCTDSW